MFKLISVTVAFVQGLYIYVHRPGNQRSPLVEYELTMCKYKQVVPMNS